MKSLIAPAALAALFASVAIAGPADKQDERVVVLPEVVSTAQYVTSPTVRGKWSAKKDEQRLAHSPGPSYRTKWRFIDAEAKNDTALAMRANPDAKPTM